jgi:hypothetical protein
MKEFKIVIHDDGKIEFAVPEDVLGFISYIISALALSDSFLKQEGSPSETNNNVMEVLQCVRSAMQSKASQT